MLINKYLRNHNLIYNTVHARESRDIRKTISLPFNMFIMSLQGNAIRLSSSFFLFFSKDQN
jgi:hypothetical protein